MTEWLRLMPRPGVLDPEAFIYRIAGLPFSAPAVLPELEAFRLSETEVAALPDAQIVSSEAFERRTQGELGGTRRGVLLRRTSVGWRLEIDGCCAFEIGQDAVLAPAQGPLLSPLFLEALLGPALLLLLAHRGRFGLHGSAVRDARGGVWLLVGASGVGKSTLAASAAECSGWSRIADDICVVSQADERLFLWPDFPQLKLPPDRQYGAARPSPLAVTAVSFLRRGSASDAPALRSLERRDLALGLLRHGVASRLFPPAVLTAQLSALGRATRHVAGFDLTVPDDLAALPSVYSVLDGAKLRHH